jgi:membrane protease YdiL (CAAX protease family)
VRRLLWRVVDYRRIRNTIWYLPVVLLPVVTLAATYGLMVVTGWQFQHQPVLPVTTMLLFVIVFLLAAAGEELGWAGYVMEPLQRRFGALGGNLVLGVIWWALHVPSIVRSGQGPTLIVLGFFGALAFRVLWGWLFNNTGGSVFAIIIVHAVTNVCTSYVPSIPTSANAPVLVVLAVLVTLLWGPRTLSRFRLARRAQPA